jgi:hypothetical protein
MFLFSFTEPQPKLVICVLSQEELLLWAMRYRRPLPHPTHGKGRPEYLGSPLGRLIWAVLAAAKK